MAYSEDLCERILADIDEGVSAYDAAERYRASVSFK